MRIIASREARDFKCKDPLGCISCDHGVTSTLYLSDISKLRILIFVASITTCTTCPLFARGRYRGLIDVVGVTFTGAADPLNPELMLRGVNLVLFTASRLSPP